MRLLVILNERKAGAHDDVYRALQKNVEAGEIESFRVFPFLEKILDGKSSVSVCKDIVELAGKYQTDMILWSHTVLLRVKDETIKILNNLTLKPVMGYWDGDIYESPYKPLPKNIIELAKNCNVVFCQGFGHMTEKLSNNGCKDIRFVPAATDASRFNVERNGKQKIFDVVMIGNNVINKLPWKRMPGAVYRKKLIKYFYSKLGDKFAVFGEGWKNSYAKGRVNFIDQTEVYHKSRLAIGVNNLHSDFYFSNRLPIAMTSGTPLLYNYEKGFEKIFTNNVVAFFNSVEEAWHKAEDLLSKTDDELSVIGVKAKDFALNNLSMEKNFSYMIRVLKNFKLNNTESIENPWIQN